MKDLREKLPAVDPSLAGYRDNLTFEMMCFRHFTEHAIARGDCVTVRRCFELLHKPSRQGTVICGKLTS